LFTTTPPLMPPDKSMASVMVLVTAPVSGNRMVLTARIEPALLMAFRLPLWSKMASDTRLKGLFAVAMALVGAIVLVETLAVMLPPRPTFITGTLAFWAMMTPKALPPPMPPTDAEMVAAVLLLPLMASAFTSRRGTVAKGPI